LITLAIATLFTGLSYGFYAFGILGWIKYPDYVAYEEDYVRTPGDFLTFDSVLNASAAMVRHALGEKTE